jgi:gliding motility-associated-like protein
MNEVWRFYPSNGPTTFRSVELLDASGAVIANGTNDTTRVDSNTWEVGFNNICAPTGTSLFVVKTKYLSITNPSDTIYSLDTINVTRQAALPIDAVIVPTNCGTSVGTITVNASGTGPYIYSIDGGATQTSNVFTGLSAGPHTIFAQDVNNCQNTITATVTAVSSLPSNITFTNCTCPSVNDGTATANPLLGTAPFTFTINGSGTLPGPNSTGIFTGLAPGTYTISFTDAQNCAGTTTAVTIGAGNAITSTSTSTGTCPGLSNGTITVTPTSGTGPYNFDLPGYTGAPPAPGPSGTFIGLSSNGLPYNVIITDANGCTGTRNVYVNPTAGISSTTSSTSASCVGVSDGSITITPTSGSGPYTFSIDGAAAVPSPTPPSITFTDLTGGPHTIVVTDASGCTGTQNVTVGTGAGINAGVNPRATSCPNVNNGSILVTPTNGNGPYLYSLDGGAFDFPVSATATFINVSSGPHAIAIIDANGCTGSVNTTIATGPGLTGAFSQTATSCPGVNDGTLTIIANGGTAPYSYALDGGALQPSGGSAPYTFSNVGFGPHQVLIQDNIGCQGTVNAIVGNGPGLSVTSNNTNPPCFGINDGAITILPSAPGSYTYTLNPGTPGQVVQNTPTFTGLAPGTYNYTITTGSGCLGIASTTITTNTPIIPGASMTMPLCFGQSNGIINASATGGVSPYEFSVDNINFQNNGTFNTIPVGPVTIRIKDAAGCLKDTSLIMSQPTQLVASASSTPGTCNGTDGTITLAGTDGTPGYTYSVDAGATYQPSPNFVVTGGTYPDIRVKDANGCEDVTSIVVTLIDNMVVTPVPDTTICALSSVVLEPNFSNEATVFEWHTLPNDTAINTLNNPNIKNPTASPRDTTYYQVKASWGICFRFDTIRVNVLHVPIPYAGNGDIICQYDSTILTGSVLDSSGPVKYAWSPAILANTPDQNQTYVDPLYTQVFTLTVTDDYGCDFSRTDTVKVTVQPPVPAFAGNDTIAVRNGQHQLTGNGGPDAVSFEWTPSFPLNFSNIYNPVATLSDDQLFVMTVTDIGGCIGKDSVFIRVYDGPTYNIPTCFTPNGDGLNDLFRAIPVGMTNTEYFRVFNRAGKLVFETNRWMKGWDGTFQGRKQPVGTYVWIVKGKNTRGETIFEKGTVILMN